MAYVRRTRFEAREHAIAVVELLAQVLSGGKSTETHGITEEGRVFKRVTSERGLAKMGVFL